MIAFFLPAFYGSSNLGVHALILGILGLAEGEYWMGVVWMANPLFFISIFISPRKRTMRYILSIIALLLAVCVIFITRVPEGSTTNFVSVIPGFGAMLWIAAMVLNVLYQRDRYNTKHRH